MMNKIKTIFRKNKKATTLALILTLTVSSFLVTLPFVIAIEPMDIDTYALLSVSPQTIGIHQQFLVVMWLDKVPPQPEVPNQLNAIPYTGFTLTITKPDGSEVILGPFTSDATGSAVTTYQPDQLGTYTFQFSYPGEHIYGRRLSGDPLVEDYYKPSTSQIHSVTVQEEDIQPISSIPPPTDYWSRPIYSEHWSWSSIAGNWLGVPLQFGTGYSSDGNFNPYTTAPNTGHILYTIPQADMGLVGGEWNEKGYYTGLSYQSKWNPPAVAMINGRLYYHKVLNPGVGFGATPIGVACVDVRSGEEIWFKEGMSFSFAQLVDLDTPNQHGINAYLWSYGFGGITVYDAFTGTELFQINSPRTGKITMSEQGDVMVYVINSANNWLLLWNSSKALHFDQGLPWSIRSSREYEWADGIMWNVTIPEVQSQGITMLGDGVLFTTSTDREANPPARIVTGYNATTGENIWQIVLDDYTIRPQYNFSPITDGVFAWYKQEALQWRGFNAYTGELLWGPTDPMDNAFAEFSAVFCGGGASNPQNAYGFIYTAGYDGQVHAINMTTGEIAWDYYTGDSHFETFYGHYPIYGGALIADNKVFIATNEHTPQDPLWRGSKLHAMDAQTGEPIWNISAWIPGAIIADGYLVGLNNYDGQIYTFGKGPSSTSILAAPKTVSQGSEVLVEGSVMDVSPGTKDYDITVRYPNGVPALADEYMSAWMEHIYMQKPAPEDTVGVSVKIQIIDPDGEYAWIGTATSDSFGNYAYSFIPQKKGIYTVIATFDGSESYWGSQATTSLTVGDAPTPYPTYPGYQGPSASEVAQSVVNSLPDNPTSEQISQAVVNAMPEYPEQQEITIPEYTTMDIILAVLVVIAIVVGVISIILRKK